jgi:hypothetical protein
MYSSVSPLPCMHWRFHPRACLAISSDGFRSVWPSHPHLHFLICKSILGCLVHFHSFLFIIWSAQKILIIFLRHLLIKTCSLVFVFWNFSRSHNRRLGLLSHLYWRCDVWFALSMPWSARSCLVRWMLSGPFVCVPYYQPPYHLCYR